MYNLTPWLGPDHHSDADYFYSKNWLKPPPKAYSLAGENALYVGKLSGLLPLYSGLGINKLSVDSMSQYLVKAYNNDLYLVINNIKNNYGNNYNGLSV